MQLPRGGVGGGEEHKLGNRGNNDSAIKKHADATAHEIHPSYMDIRKWSEQSTKSLFWNLSISFLPPML